MAGEILTILEILHGDSPFRCVVGGHQRAPLEALAQMPLRSLLYLPKKLHLLSLLGAQFRRRGQAAK